VKKILVIGDICVDEYVYGSVPRISPEAPVPIFVPKTTEEKRGMAANVADNLKMLGADVVEVYGQSSKKTRLIDLDSKQQLMRIDKDARSRPIAFNAITGNFYAAIVVSDYDKGAVTYELIDYLASKYHCPMFIDTKKTDLQRFDGCFVKINTKEYLAAQTYNDHLIVTHGAKGASYKGKSFPANNVEVSDVCGAGDTFLAALAFKYLDRDDIDDAIEFAIRASEITVQHTGVYAPTLDEIYETKRNN
jgi:D-beta-D-heptose 7-phosphate kinase/D-beta-D-heptose 1-phosphate adenosyltransferase